MFCMNFCFRALMFYYSGVILWLSYDKFVINFISFVWTDYLFMFMHFLLWRNSMWVHVIVDHFIFATPLSVLYVVYFSWSFSHFVTLSLFDEFKWGEFHARTKSNAHIQGELWSRQQMLRKFCHHQKKGVCECTILL